ncbi:MAG: hypothetical protein AAGF20_13990 [Pseudomonadota bacterium]
MGTLSVICGFVSLIIGFAFPPLAWILAIAGIVFGVMSYRKNIPKVSGKKVKDLAEMEIPSVATGAGVMLAGTGIALSVLSALLGLFTIFTLIMFSTA